MGIFLALIAGLFIPLTNLCIRKGMDIGGNAKAFFVFQMIASTLAALFLGPLQEGDFFIPLSPSLLGALGGILFSIMLFSLGRALEKGPPGFTFAILNSAIVMPGYQNMQAVVMAVYRSPAEALGRALRYAAYIVSAFAPSS